MIVLENDFLKLSVQQKGAELISLYRKDIRKELLWNADARWWNRHAPVLFPCVGKLKNDTYQFQGKNYLMGQHGFARDMVFEIKEQQPHTCTLTLSYTEQTLQLFPFRFHLVLGYTLQNNQVICSYQVINNDSGTMYFSIGAHPGFVCPLFEKEQLNDYTLVFDKEEQAGRHLLTNGIFDYRKEHVLKGTTLPLTDDLFAKDAIVLKEINSSSVTLRSSKNPYSLKVSFEGFPYLGIWKKTGAKFLCIEPWFGLADHMNHNGKLEEKEGILTLQPEEIFEAAYQIEIN